VVVEDEGGHGEVWGEGLVTLCMYVCGESEMEVDVSRICKVDLRWLSTY